MTQADFVSAVAALIIVFLLVSSVWMLWDMREVFMQHTGPYTPPTNNPKGKNEMNEKSEKTTTRRVRPGRKEKR